MSGIFMTKGLNTLICLSVAMLLIRPTHLSAQQTTGDAKIPPQRAHHALAFDAARGEVILFGG
jgi:hypothetical protein